MLKVCVKKDEKSSRYRQRPEGETVGKKETERKGKGQERREK